MNVRIANTNVRTNTGKSGCVGPPLKESWSYHIRSVPIYTLRIASTDTGFDPESVSRCKLQSLSLKSYIGSHSAATTPATILSGARYQRYRAPGTAAISRQLSPHGHVTTRPVSRQGGRVKRILGRIVPGFVAPRCPAT